MSNERVKTGLALTRKPPPPMSRTISRRPMSSRRSPNSAAFSGGWTRSDRIEPRKA